MRAVRNEDLIVGRKYYINLSKTICFRFIRKVNDDYEFELINSTCSFMPNRSGYYPFSSTSWYEENDFKFGK